MEAYSPAPMNLEEICPRCEGRGVTRLTATERYRLARKKSGRTLRGFAREIGVSHAYLGDVERGNRPFTPRLVEAYEQILSEQGVADVRQDLRDRA